MLIIGLSENSRLPIKSETKSCKVTPKLKFSGLTHLIDPTNIKKTFRNMKKNRHSSSIEPKKRQSLGNRFSRLYRETNSKTTERTTKLYEFLHSEKHVRNLKSKKQSLGFVTFHKNKGKNNIEKNTAKIQNLRKSVNIRIRNRPNLKKVSDKIKTPDRKLIIKSISIDEFSDSDKSVSFYSEPSN